MSEPGALRRHDLVDVAPEVWADATAALNLPDGASRIVGDWCRRGWPVIVRRRLAGDDAEAVPVAFQLPNAADRLRLALSVPPAAVSRRPPLGLAEAAASAPVAWYGTIASLLALASSFGAPAVFGGLLWQHVTGEAVLRPGSDLDLVWHPEPDRRRDLLEALAGLDRGAVRVDGEIVLDDGGGVSWRELQAAAEGRTSHVAVKTTSGVALREARAILCETAPC